jgi:hypothetical protein
MDEVRAFVRQNPTMKPIDISKAIGCDRGRAYNARCMEGVSKPTPRFNSIAPKTGLKTVRISTIKAKDDRIAQLEDELLEMKTRPEFAKPEPTIIERITYIPSEPSAEYEAEMAKLRAELSELRAELSEARVVISYLEKKRHGTSV